MHDIYATPLKLLGDFYFNSNYSAIISSLK